jgi:predicted nucleic acid-binding protein
VSVFVDTSALYALLDRSDDRHAEAAATFPALRSRLPVTHGYVVVEAVALTQIRLGMAAVRRLLDDLLAVIDVRYVDRDLHRLGVAALLASGTRSVSLVDRVSFALMRTENITEAFAFDEHFQREGFALLTGR